MTPDVEDRLEAGPGKNGRSEQDPDIHEDASEDQLQFGTWDDVVRYDHRPEGVHITPPEHREHPLTAVNVYREHLERKKIARKGYVQWFLIDSGWPQPRWVQPKQKGGGVPELEHDGHRYLFPKAAMLPSDREGAWTIAHRKGEADPIDLREREPGEPPAIPADSLEDYINIKVTATSPAGLLGGLDIDPRQVFVIAVMLFVGFLMAQQVGLL